MVRQVKAADPPTTAGWKAILAMTVAGGALLWHVLACIESPMAFSPSGKDLAFVTGGPSLAEGKDAHLAGARVFRMMVLSDGKHIRAVEQTDRHLLTAPAYSPNGQQLCYFRVPLLTEKQAKEALKTVRQRLARWKPPEAETHPAAKAAGPVLPPFT